MHSDTASYLDAGPDDGYYARACERFTPRCLHPRSRDERQLTPVGAWARVELEVDHGHARVVSEPVDPALERARLPDHHRADPELADQPAAVPARRQRRDHDRVPVGAPAAGVLEGRGLTVQRRV